MHGVFEYAYGSTIGHSHYKSRGNNQDNYYLIQRPELTIGVVCDGCGSSAFSEMGSRMGSWMVAKRLEEVSIHTVDVENIPTCLSYAHSLVVKDLMDIATRLGINLVDAVSHSLLFTIVAMIVGEKNTIVASIGDGFYAVNGEVKEIGPFENNAPPFIGYELVKDIVSIDGSNKFVINKIIETSQVNNIMIATDGLSYVDNNKDKRLINGDIMGEISQFWEDDNYFRDDCYMDKRLQVMNETSVKPYTNIINGGFLYDDTTIISLRRK